MGKAIDPLDPKWAQTRVAKKDANGNWVDAGPANRAKLYPGQQEREVIAAQMRGRNANLLKGQEEAK